MKNRWGLSLLLSIILLTSMHALANKTVSGAFLRALETEGV